MLKRSSLLSLLLLAAIAFVGSRIYHLWQDGPWELPNPGRGVKPPAVAEAKEEPDTPPAQLVSTKSIIEKNLFDPDRGTSKTKETDASSLAMQRLRNIVLLGTAVLGNNTHAIVQEPPDARVSGGPRPQPGQQAQIRLKLGDVMEGFRLSEIHDRKIVFSRGTSRVEIALDYFRKVETGQQKVPVAAPSRAPAKQPARMPVIPRIPRREATPGDDR
ncbi:MAG: hypothetical protein HY695_32580 [Deltaproteobacteria bacterium]|nr:hypothetical protein [Deltaproteobacteria bacterium]